MLKSKLIAKLVITSPDDKILNIIKKRYKSKILIIKRPETLAVINTETKKTFRHTLKKIKSKKISFDYIMDISFRTPCMNTKTIDDGIHTMQLFNSDKIISVTQETHRYYKHDGSGLKSLIKTSNLKLERDAIYKQINGFSITKKNLFFKRDYDLKIGHIVLNQNEALEINSDEDLKNLNKIS